MRGTEWYGTNHSSAGLLFIPKFLGVNTVYHCRFVYHSPSLVDLARARYNLGSNSQYQEIAYGFSTPLNYNFTMSRRTVHDRFALDVLKLMTDALRIVRIVPASSGGIKSAMPLDSLVSDLTNNSYFAVLFATKQNAPMLQTLELSAASCHWPDAPERFIPPKLSALDLMQ